MNVDVIIRARIEGELVGKVLEEVRRFDREVAIMGIRHMVVVFEGGKTPGKIRLRLDDEEEGLAYLYVDPEALRGDYRLALWRELAVINAVNDPGLVQIWAVPDEYTGAPMSRELSVALLRRTVDMLVAKVDPMELPRAFDPLDMTLLRGARAEDMVAALALDVPLSLEMAGLTDLGREVYANKVKGKVPPVYDDFREFVKRTRNYVSAYNYLSMVANL